MAGMSPGHHREPFPDPADARTLKEFGTALRRMRERCAKLAVDRMRDPGSRDCWKELRREFIQAVECGFHQAESDDDVHDFLSCFIRACLRGRPEAEVTAEVVRWQNAWRQLSRLPAPDAPPGVPHEVPAPATRHFVGRVHELSELDTLISTSGDDTTSVALVGAAGVGKTTLALYWAAHSAGWFPSGQIYVNLRGFGDIEERLSPALALRNILSSLNVPDEEIPTSLDSLEARFRTEISDRRLLLLLDNAYDAEQVRPLLPGSGPCRTLITSRRFLGGLGVLTVPVRHLTDDEAAGLLKRTVGEDRLRAEPGSLARVVTLCAGLPLALSIVAEGLVARPNTLVADAVDELEPEDERLGTLALHDRADIRRVLRWSYQSLGAEQAALFRHLGLHEGPEIGAEAAATLAGRPVPATRRLMRELVDVHLVEQLPAGRYRLHDLVRLYARECAEEIEPREREEAVRRVLEWYLAGADAADRVFAPERRRVPLSMRTGVAFPGFPDTRAAFAWCDREADNLIRATGQAARLGMDDLAWQLAAASGEYYYLRNRCPDLLQIHRLAAASSRNAGGVADGWILNNLGLACQEVGLLEEALEHCAAAASANRREGDRFGEGIALNNLGLTYLELHRWEDAETTVGEALRVFREIGSEWGIAHALRNLGRVELGRGRWSEATEILEKAADLHLAIGNRAVQGWALYESGLGQASAGAWDAAVGRFEQSLAVHEEAGDRLAAAMALDGLGGALQALGRHDEALHRWEQALVVFDALGHPRAAEVRSKLIRQPG
ncbi:ATP-binding protein [Microbispora sp. CA-135349]|uniref:ATP-binding protein n=1 Tax=Microbispora sp. CA-135349 TaxID=3239953 RepID=UPI003D8EECA7